MRRLALLAAALLALGTACGSGSDASEGKRLTVFAAASLNKAFTSIGAAFETETGAQVSFSFAGSQTLVAQLQQGAPADVLATADLATIERVRLEREPIVFARNQLAIVTPPGNPLRIRTLADLARPGRKVVLAGPTVPVGKAAAQALEAADVHLTPISWEEAVTGVVTKVRLGEADAGIAYVTDLTGLGAVPLPGAFTSLAVGALSPEAQEFVDFLLSPTGQRILAAHGFLPPT